jgi:hypothetical protein
LQEENNEAAIFLKHLYASRSDTSQAGRWRDKALSFQQLVYENVRLRK